MGSPTSRSALSKAMNTLVSDAENRATSSGGPLGSGTYDGLARLSTAATTGSAGYPAWGLRETYDRYGNRLSQTAISGCTGISCPQPSVAVTLATNHLIGPPYAYDANGNMTNDGLNTQIVYDAENHAVSSSGSLGSGTYTYDGNGFRVKKVAGSTTTVYVFSGPKVIAEYDNGTAPSSPSREYVYGGSALLAKIDSSGTKYYHQDHLSNRLVTSSTGNTLAQMGHFPFGESWYNSTSDKLLFTTYERDAESGNDYAQARYYVNRLARFLSLDPLAGDISDPQSLNRYNYVENDPANLVDPSGADPEVVPTCQLTEDPCPNPPVATIILNVWAPYCEPGECGSLDPSYNPGYMDPSQGGGDQIGDPQPGLSQFQPPTLSSLFPKVAKRALELVMKPDCMDFLIGVQRAGMSIRYGSSSTDPYASPYWAGISTNYSPASNQWTANNTPVVDMRSTNKASGGFVTNAEISGNYLPNFGGAVITVYQGFSSEGLLQQAQDMVHEGVHGYAGLNDQQIAAAAGVPGALNMTQSQASAAFNNVFRGKCK